MRIPFLVLILLNHIWVDGNNAHDHGLLKSKDITRLKITFMYVYLVEINAFNHDNKES